MSCQHLIKLIMWTMQMKGSRSCSEVMKLVAGSRKGKHWTGIYLCGIFISHHCLNSSFFSTINSIIILLTDTVGLFLLFFHALNVLQYFFRPLYFVLFVYKRLNVCSFLRLPFWKPFTNANHLPSGLWAPWTCLCPVWSSWTGSVLLNVT